MKQRNLFLITLLFLFSLLYSQERGFKIIARSSEGQIISLYKGSYALVIGVSDYESGWPDLSNAGKDAEAVGDLLASLGFEVTRLINPSEYELTQALKNFVFGPGQDPDNCLVIFFAGHGHTEKMAYGADLGYIVPKDAPLPLRDKAGFMQRAINMQTIEGYARSIQAKHALFLFDSCFSGAIFDMVRAVPAAINYKTANPVRQFITAGGADEAVPDRSIFKGQLVEALKGEGDLNRDGYITGTELGEFLQEKVVNYSRNSQHPQYGKIRDPNLDKGDFVFVLDKARPIEAEVQIPPKPPETKGVDVTSLKKAAEERERVKGQWESWQERMRSDFSDIEKVDKSASYSREEKKVAWEEFLKSYRADNPFSSEDEQLRERAAQRIKELSEIEVKVQARVSLRSFGQSLNESEVEVMLKRHNFFSGQYDLNKNYCNPSGDFANNYESSVINGDKVVLDHSTGLMWHQSGSDNYMTYGKAKQWIDDLNRGGYAGYHDWRLPTIEEGASLIESSNMNNDLYIDPVFSAEHRWIWTSDAVSGSSGRVWVVDFYYGFVDWNNVDYVNYVRPVRSGQELATDVNVTSLKEKEEAKKKAEEEAARIRSEWDEWQLKMQSNFAEVEKIDRSPDLASKDKKDKWQKFLEEFSADNPFSGEDEQLRERAAQRVNELSKIEISVGARVSLRSYAQNLSENEVGAMLKRYNFFSKQYDFNRASCNPSGDFSNSYESRVMNGDKVVLDHATGLMWYQSGSEESMTYAKAKQWIDDLNRRGYAGYRDWRLPTLEEGASLLERTEMNGDLFIDPVFSGRQRWIWTSDAVSGSSGRIWVVFFVFGDVCKDSVDHYLYYDGFVRPVRSGQ